MTNTHVPTGEPWYGHDGFGCAPNLCQSCRDELDALRAENQRLQAECIRWLQAIIDGPDLLSKTTAESAIKALASDKRLLRSG